MKSTPILLNKDFKKETKTPFFASQITLIGLTHYPGKSKKDYGRVALMFLLTDKMDSNECLFVQKLFDLETEDELNFVLNCPANVKNFSKEYFEKTYIPLASRSIPGENSFGSEMTFSVPIVPTTNTYYEFECLCTLKDTKTDIVKRVHVSKADYIRLSQVLYWFATGFPFLLMGHDIFYDRKYKDAEILNVKSIIFDGSTEMISGENTMVMAHFTIFTDDVLKRNQFGINVPCAPIERLLYRHPIDTKEYEALYKNDDTISPDRMFVFTSPSPAYALLSGDLDSSTYRIFKIDIELAEKIHWLDWGYFIFFHKHEKRRKTDNVNRKDTVINIEDHKITS